MVNDSNFAVRMTTEIVKNMTNIGSVLSNLSEEQSNIINVSILKPAIIKMETFNDLLQPYTYSPKVPFFNIFIGTTDTLRYQHLMETLLKSQMPILLTGQAGSGKTSVSMNMLNQLDRRQITQNIIVNFSARTSSLRVQQLIEESLF